MISAKRKVGNSDALYEAREVIDQNWRPPSTIHSAACL